MRWQLSKSGESYYIKDRKYVAIIKVTEGNECYGVIRAGAPRNSRDPNDKIVAFEEGGTFEESLNLLAVKYIEPEGKQVQEYFKWYWQPLANDEEPTPGDPAYKGQPDVEEWFTCPHCNKALALAVVAV